MLNTLTLRRGSRIRLHSTKRTGTLLESYYDEGRHMFLHTIKWDDKVVPEVNASWEPLRELAEELAR